MECGEKRRPLVQASPLVPGYRLNDAQKGACSPKEVGFGLGCMEGHGTAIWLVLSNFLNHLKLLNKRGKDVWNWRRKSFQIALNSIQFGLKKKSSSNIV